MEAYIISIYGIVEKTAFVDLKAAANHCGLNYNSVKSKRIRNGKRTFNKGIVITQCNVVGSGRVGNRLKFDRDKWKQFKKSGNVQQLDQEQQRMENWRNDITFDEA